MKREVVAEHSEPEIEILSDVTRSGTADSQTGEIFRSRTGSESSNIDFRKQLQKP